MNSTVLAIFSVVYLGMIAGGLPLASHPLAGPVLALASTLAGNLLIVGSIANIIVVDCAARRGVPIDWRRHARFGVPVTLATLAVAGAWLWIVA